MSKEKKVCPVCNGAGHYSYDDNHSKLCEFCCPHDQGWFELTEIYGNYIEGGDNGVCRRGCGQLRRDLKKIVDN